MEYLYEFRFFVKEVVFSTSVHKVFRPTVGIRLIDFPSLLVYPSDDVNAKRRYPKGKHCTFIMSIAKLLYQLKAATFPIQLYIISHSNDKPLKVMSQGFCRDQYLLDSLTSLSEKERKAANLIAAEKVFYNRTVVVPVFEESKFPVGSVTLKITAKIMHTSCLTSCQDSSTGQLVAVLDPSVATQPVSDRSLATRHSATKPVHDHDGVCYLPNVWFPPPLCYTSNIISAIDDTLSKEEKPEDHRSGSCSRKYTSANIPDETIATFLNPVTDHWNVVAGASSFPWKSYSDVTSKFRCTSANKDSRSKFEQQSGHDKTSEDGLLQNYPCLSAMYRELALLHNNLPPVADKKLESIKDCKSQFVQTDPPSGETIVTIINDQEMVTLKCAESQFNKSTAMSGDSTTESPKQDKKTDEADEAQKDSVGVLSKQEDIHDPASLSDPMSNSEPILNLENTSSLANNANLMDSSISQALSRARSSSSSLSDIEGSRPIIPQLTLSQPSIASISSQQNGLVTRSSPHLLHTATPAGNSSTNLKLPLHPLQNFRSVESTLTVTASSNEVKCGNPLLGQKVYLAASLQSIDRETSSQQELEGSPVMVQNTNATLKSTSDSSTVNSISNTEISELLSEVTPTDNDKALFELHSYCNSYSDDFESDKSDNYSDDFESDDNSQ